MNIHDITIRIENPALLQSSDIPVLHELSKKYPYAQIFSLLYLKALAKDQSLELEDALTKHAYKITDRIRLFEILNETQEETSYVQELYENDAETLTIAPNKELENSITEIENQQDNSGISDKTKNQIQPTEPDIQEENTITKVVSKKDEELKENNEKELDLSIIANAISGVFEREFEPQRTLENKNSTTINTIDENNIPDSSIQKVSTIKGSKQPFSNWVKAGKKAEINEKTINPLDNIIDTFIKEDPKISQPKKEFYSPIKQAKKSLDTENIQYTETLANILSIQGNYPKAILAFEQLCLTIPEKKSYFVKKIKELKEKLNS